MFSLRGTSDGLYEMGDLEYKILEISMRYISVYDDVSLSYDLAEVPKVKQDIIAWFV